MKEDHCRAFRQEVWKLGREIEQAAGGLRAFAGTKPLDPSGHPGNLTERDIERMMESQRELGALLLRFNDSLVQLVECMRRHGEIGPT
jgi:hypothetical protein